MEELERERHAYLVSEKQRYEDEVYALARKLEQLASTIDVVACARQYRENYVKLGYFSEPAICRAGPVKWKSSDERPLPRDATVQSLVNSRYFIYAAQGMGEFNIDFYARLRPESFFSQ